ncbi:MAG: hypothetical protein C4576_09165 [Desulfobacteraceae bacterium]|nr:MAG: hypothetical protein C4576_09165 [Desulfobacteraceae bacterium]
MSGNLKKRIECLEQRLIPKAKQFSIENLSADEAVEMIDFHRRACLAFQQEFGGDSIEEAEQSLSIQEKARHWFTNSSNIVVKLIMEDHWARDIEGEESEMLERARMVPELAPFVEMVDERRRESPPFGNPEGRSSFESNEVVSGCS